MSSRLKISGIFQLVCGGGIIAIWIISLLQGSIPELKTEPVRIAMHLMAEAATGASLFASGLYIYLRREKCISLFYLSSGALLYTLIISPGYFTQKGQWGIAALFLILLVTNVAILAAQRADDPI